MKIVGDEFLDEDRESYASLSDIVSSIHYVAEDNGDELPFVYYVSRKIDLPGIRVRIEGEDNFTVLNYDIIKDLMHVYKKLLGDISLNEVIDALIDAQIKGTIN